MKQRKNKHAVSNKPGKYYTVKCSCLIISRTTCTILSQKNLGIGNRVRKVSKSILKLSLIGMEVAGNKIS